MQVAQAPSSATLPHDSPGIDGDTSVSSTAKQTAVAASVASILTKSLLHPLDTLKCRVQIYSTTWRGSGTVSSPAVGAEACATRKPTVAAWREIRQRYMGMWGPRYLYGGLPAKLLFYVPYQTIYLTSYNATRDTLIERAVMATYSTELQPQQHQNAAPRAVPTTGSPSRSALLSCTIAAAVAAEVSSCIVRVPMETLKMRIQSTVANGTGDALRQLRRNGTTACLRLALPQTLMHDVPYSVIQWVAYEALRPQWTRPALGAVQPPSSSSSSSSPSPKGEFLRAYRCELIRTFFSGGFSGLVAAALTLPLDNVRTRMIVATAHDPSLRVRDMVTRVYRGDGVPGFFRGGSMRVLWVTANMACYFPLFECCRAALVWGVADCQEWPSGVAVVATPIAAGSSNNTSGQATPQGAKRTSATATTT